MCNILELHHHLVSLQPVVVMQQMLGPTPSLQHCAVPSAWPRVLPCTALAHLLQSLPWCWEAAAGILLVLPQTSSRVSPLCQPSAGGGPCLGWGLWRVLRVVEAAQLAGFGALSQVSSLLRGSMLTACSALGKNSLQQD